MSSLFPPFNTCFVFNLIAPSYPLTQNLSVVKLAFINDYNSQDRPFLIIFTLHFRNWIVWIDQYCRISELIHDLINVFDFEAFKYRFDL